MSLPIPDMWWLHVGACMFAGMLAWTLGLALHRGLRISHAARIYWLIVWALAVLPTGLVIAFHYLAPESWPISTPLPLPSVAGLEEWSSDFEFRSHEVRASSSVRDWLEPLLWLLYLTGAGVAALRWGKGVLAVRRIVQGAGPVDSTDLPGSLAVAEQQRLRDVGIALRSTTRSISPFAVCWPQPTIIVPTALMGRLSDCQLQMVLRHEANHLAQYDPQRAALMRLVGVVLWFNPFLRLIADRVQIAAELCCDAVATRSGLEARRAYAAAYLEALRLSARAATPSPVAAFSRHDPGSHKLRIRHMVQGDSRCSLPLWLSVALIGLALAAGSALAAVQIGVTTPARSQVVVAVAGDSPSMPVAPEASPLPSDEAVMAHAINDVFANPAIRFGFPVAKPRITSRYGADGGSRTRPHRGLDFAAVSGAPVYAPANATVTAATTQYPDGPDYGTVVVLDHGGGWQSLYAHLDSFDVQPGQRVTAGTQIGRAGITGKVTGPHVHMEMLLNGQRVDPEPLLR